MKPGDLVRINLPEMVRSAPSYYYNDYVGVVLRVTKHESQGLPSLSVAVLVDGMEREFSERYLEVVSEAG